MYLNDRNLPQLSGKASFSIDRQKQLTHFFAVQSLSIKLMVFQFASYWFSLSASTDEFLLCFTRVINYWTL